MRRVFFFFRRRTYNCFCVIHGEINEIKEDTGKARPVVTIKSSRYQPTNAELDELVHIPISPEQLTEAAASPDKTKSEKF